MGQEQSKTELETLTGLTQGIMWPDSLEHQLCVKCATADFLSVTLPLATKSADQIYHTNQMDILP